MLKISAPINKRISGTLEIPASKSISNRCLIIQAIATEKISLENLSISDDTKILSQALQKIKLSNENTPTTINIGLAGTAFRFLTAYLSTQKGNFILSGHQRIKERPIKPLVDALISLGADIEYLENEGFAPLLIKGKQLFNSPIEIDASISSQFITALLLISPKIKNGLTLKLIGKVSSLPYIKMTLSLMNHFGIKSNFNNNSIDIENQEYSENSLFIEGDWSSASYFYQCLALADSGSLILKNYNKTSIQGDSKLADIFAAFGIKTIFKKNEIELIKTTKKLDLFDFDFSNQPDLAQTFTCLCVALNIKAELTGLESLIIKETDRILALNNEINKLNWEFVSTDNEVYSLQKNSRNKIKNELIFETYNDHRMAMCLAPLSLKFECLTIMNPEVVSKSNPIFWQQMKEIGFEIENLDMKM